MASFTPQEIEQFLQQFFDVVGTRQYIGARYVPIFGRKGEDTINWDNLAPYEPLTVVMHNGVSYVSKQYVPTGTEITDTDFWAETYRFNAQVEQYRQEVLSFQAQIDNVRDDMESDYVPFPDSDTYPKYGVLGQVLTTLTGGETKWEDPVVVDAAIAEPLIEAWLDAHPEATTTVQDGAITTAKLANGAVTDSKLAQSGGVLSDVQILNEKVAYAESVIDDMVVYDYESVEVTYENGIYETDGDLRDDVGRHTRIQVNPGEQYKISSYKYSASYPACLFENGTTLVSYDNTPSAGAFNDLIVTIPSGADNMIVNGRDNYDISVQKGVAQQYYTAESGEELSEQVDILNEKVAYTESAIDAMAVYDYETVGDLTYETGIYSTGNSLRTDTGRHVRIQVNPEEQYKISSYKYSSSYPACLFENGTTLVSYDNTPSAGAFNDLIVTIPSGADNMIVNGRDNYDISVQKYTIQQYYTAESGEELEDKVNEMSPIKPYLYDDITGTLTFEDNILNRWNSHNTAQGKRSSLSVTEGEGYYYAAYKFSSDYPLYLFRKNGVIVDYYNPAETGGNMSAQFVVPSGVDEVVFNAAINGFVYLAKKRTVRAMPYSKWDNRKIAWFGTSIPERSTYNPVLGYPEYVGELLGATVYNEAVGSSCARRGFKSAESADDPYGWTGMGVAALWNMGSTIAEKNEIITNWESKWRNLTGYNVALTDSTRAKTIACSYENKLVQKYITENPVDLYVFDHGYNDWKVGDISIDPNDPFDMSTFQGAMNTYIKLIFESNPRARIAIISHYEDQECAGLIEMQKEEAAYWNLPFCKLYENLGWAGNRTIETEGYWGTGSYDKGIWHETGGEQRTITLKQLHMVDGKHPNNDRSGHACMDIAYVIAEFINHITPIE